MKGNEKTLSVLYLLLENELNAINQYIVLNNGGEKQDISNLLNENRKVMNVMQRAKWLIKQIIYLDGSSNVSKFIALKFDITGSKLFRMEEGHIDWAEMQRLQTVQMDMGKYSCN